MAKKLKLGIIGMSEGNGHPYSWSAIFNGYDAEKMQNCPFPVIPKYLGDRNFPKDGLGEFGEVTHIWTQSMIISKNIAESSKIKVVTERIEDMIGEVDAVLLARDDAENHYKMALPFLKAGLPIFIDKPLALSEKGARAILSEQQYENQIFSCSSIRFAKELNLTEEEAIEIGEIVHVEATIPKKWDTYGIHLIEPIVARIPERGKFLEVKCLHGKAVVNCIVKWENTTAYLKVTGNIPVSIHINFFGENGMVSKQFSDSYSCFKESLHKFVRVIHKEEANIDREETLEIIRILEKGRK